jgi:hypothetical protein
VQPVEGVGKVWSADGGRGDPVGHDDPGAGTASVSREGKGDLAQREPLAITDGRVR